MPAQDGIKMADDAIKKSKEVLAKAVKFNGPVKPTKGAPVAETPKPKSSGLLEGPGTDIAAESKAKGDNIGEYVKNVPKMHKGGEVKEDGVKNLQEGEVVIPKEKAEEGKKVLALKKKAGPMSAAVEEEENEPKEKSEGKKKTSDKHNPEKEEKGEKEGEKKPAAKKSGKKVKGMHIRKAHSGGFIVKHDMSTEAGADGKMPEQEEHAIPDMAALQSHMQDHMGDEEASAGAPAAAAPAAEEAPAQA
jgi:hypothetical protein